MKSSLFVDTLRVNYLSNPLGIDSKEIFFSWKIKSDGQNVMQEAYQITVKENSKIIWDSGKINSDNSINIVYEGPAPRSGQRYYWSVKVWALGGKSVQAEEVFWEMGLLHPSEWKAKWIEPDWHEDKEVFNPSPYLRKEFLLSVNPSSARVYMTCHGLYELYINGRRVSNEIFAPGYTSYKERLQYQVYDVTDFLKKGKNAVGAVLGDGWWRGKVSGTSLRNVYGSKLGLLLQLKISTAKQDMLIVTDESWKAAVGPILKSDFKDGEVYDAGLEMPGWEKPDFDDSSWKDVRVADYKLDNLVATETNPVKYQEEFSPVDIFKTPNGETVIDFGQNIAGVVELRVKGEKGTTVKLAHGETLDEKGNFSLKHLQISNVPPLLQEVSYTLKGGSEEAYKPHFTFHGFRYVKVEGFPDEPKKENFTAIAIYSDMPKTGTFECSDPLINRLGQNIEWSMKGNFLDIPTDCPQRERAGWTGDAQVFFKTGSLIMETAAFFKKWLKDLEAEQRNDGLVTNLAPNPWRYASLPGIYSVLNNRIEGSAGWGDAATIIPWNFYQIFGDKNILKQQYESMKAWVKYQQKMAAKVHWSKKINPFYLLNKKKRAREHLIWDTDYHWGEWALPGMDLMLGLLRNLLFVQDEVATAYFAFSSLLLSKTAKILGYREDGEEYFSLYKEIRDAYRAEYIKKNGKTKPNTQDSYVRALNLGLFSKELEAKAAERLMKLIVKNKRHLNTGFLSTPFLCYILAEYGYLDLAYDLLNQKTYPSWLYAVTKGATTIWELWNGIDEKGMVKGSHNHYSYGAIGSWLYEVAAGIKAEEPGYKRILIEPKPGGGLTDAGASLDSVHGLIKSEWKIENGKIHFKVAIPPNTKATIKLPGRNKGYAKVDEVGSGEYEYSYEWS